MKAGVLKILRGAGDYVSGQQLCEQFQVSRTAVWKVIQQLKDEGYEIEAVKNRGYRILGGPEVMTAEEVESRLRTRFMGRACVFLESVDSTNNYARKLAEEGAEDGTLVLAEQQTSGKGRRGRDWLTPRGEQVAMTLLLRPRIRPEHASRLTLLMAMAVTRAIRKETGLPAMIKWPNDVVIHGKKVCGILTELNTEIDYIHYVVIGVGINANQEEFPPELKTTATSLRLELGRRVSRAELAAEALAQLEGIYEIFLKTENLSRLQKEYNELCVNCQKKVRVLDPGGEYTGTSEGINGKGELLVRREDGKLVRVYAGEVSVRGIYGYV